MRSRPVAVDASRRWPRSLAQVGLTADDIGVLSKHDTSTGVNERNESELHERLAAAIGRSDGNPLFVVSQKTLTGHAKGGAAAFQLIGLCQVLSGGVIPPNRSLDCVMDDLAEHEHLVWLREPLATGQLKAGLVTSLGFGHVAGLIAVVHPQAFVATLGDDGARCVRSSGRRLALIEGRMRLVRAMYGGALAVRASGGPSSRAARACARREAAMLLDPDARLGEDGAYYRRRLPVTIVGVGVDLVHVPSFADAAGPARHAVRGGLPAGGAA